MMIRRDFHLRKERVPRFLSRSTIGILLLAVVLTYLNEKCGLAYREIVLETVLGGTTYFDVVYQLKINILPFPYKLFASTYIKSTRGFDGSKSSISGVFAFA